ncbi:SKI/DACH domain protein [Wolffia australiana]
MASKREKPPRREAHKSPALSSVPCTLLNAIEPSMEGQTPRPHLRCAPRTPSREKKPREDLQTPPRLSIRTWSDPRKTREKKEKISAVCEERKKTEAPPSRPRRLGSFLNSLFSAAVKPKNPVKVASVDKGREEYFCCFGEATTKRSAWSTDEKLQKERNSFQGVNKHVDAYEERMRDGDNGTIRRQEEDDGESVDSYCSSDLFEIKDLWAIGLSEDGLPVYETTEFRCVHGS